MPRPAVISTTSPSLRMAAPVLICCAVWLSACGGGKAGSSSGGVPTKDQAGAYAKAVNLGPKDLPIFKFSPSLSASTAAERVDANVAHCAGGLAPGRAVAEVASEQFEREIGLAHQLALSEVTVMPSRSLAAQNLAAIEGPKAPECITRYLKILLEARLKGPVTIEESKASPLSVDAPGVDGRFGRRLTMTVTGSGAQFPLTLDLLAFTNGRAEVTLVVAGLPEPFSESTEKHVFSQILSRATSHSI